MNKSDIKFSRNVDIALIILAGIVALLFWALPHKQYVLSNQYQGLVDWSTTVNPVVTLPSATNEDVEELKQRFDASLVDKNAVRAAVTVPQESKRDVHVLGRISRDKNSYILANTFGQFSQMCTLTPGGHVAYLDEDELTYLVSYQPPMEGALAAGACMGNEMFLLAKKFK